MGTLAGRRVVVTGGAGFLGRAVCNELRKLNPANVFVPRSAQYDLCEATAIRKMLRDAEPDMVIHLAATVGGIGANMKNPGRYFYANAIMGIQLMEESRLFGVNKYLQVGTVCSYPKNTPVPFRESDLWSGYPEETNAPYGIAKKALIVQANAYRQQYGMNAVSLIPVNLYGPGDNFDPETSHVIPALIRKAIEARNSKRPSITVWGSGKASREFLFVQDAARAIAMAAEQYDEGEPINIGSGNEISIHELVKVICELVGYGGRVEWETSKPDGQPRRCLDTESAKRSFGFSAAVSIRDGLQKTIDWYESTLTQSKAA